MPGIVLQANLFNRLLDRRCDQRFLMLSALLRDFSQSQLNIQTDVDFRGHGSGEAGEIHQIVGIGFLLDQFEIVDTEVMVVGVLTRENSRLCSDGIVRLRRCDFLGRGAGVYRQRQKAANKYIPVPVTGIAC